MIVSKLTVDTSEFSKSADSETNLIDSTIAGCIRYQRIIRHKICVKEGEFEKKISDVDKVAAKCS
jgi:hypothetical protein